MHRTKDRNMKKSDIAEFTLMEIIVMIVGILATFGIPSYRQARINSIVRAKEKNIILAETAAKQYATERGVPDIFNRGYRQILLFMDLDHFILRGALYRHPSRFAN